MNAVFTSGDFENYDYIVNHKRDLMTAFNMYVSVYHLIDTSTLNVDYEKLKERILTHDLDKISGEIFYAYTNKFFNETKLKSEEFKCKNKPFPDYMLSALNLDSEETIEEEWKKASEKHYKNNRHHPEYFKINKKEMEDIDTVELCIDFTAMSLKYGGNPYDYYSSKKKELKDEFGDIIDHEKVSNILKVISKHFEFKKPKKQDD